MCGCRWMSISQWYVKVRGELSGVTSFFHHSGDHELRSLNLAARTISSALYSLSEKHSYCDKFFHITFTIVTIFKYIVGIKYVYFFCNYHHHPSSELSRSKLKLYPLSNKSQFPNVPSLSTVLISVLWILPLKMGSYKSTVVVHGYDPSTQELRQEDYYKFKTNLGFLGYGWT